MGSVTWMTAILIIQTIVSVVICAMLAIKTESVVDESKDSLK